MKKYKIDEIYDEIINHIRLGNLSLALKILTDFSEEIGIEDVKNRVLMLSSRYNHYQNNLHKGVLKHEDDEKINKIISSTIEISNVLKKNAYNLFEKNESFNTVPKKENPSTNRLIRFEVSSEVNVSKAELLGDFTSWENSPIIMKSIGNRKFYCEIPLDKGSYKFKFKLDGKWKELMNDGYPVRKNPFGTLNYNIDIN